MKNKTVKFSNLENKDGTLTEVKTRLIKQSDIMKCRFYILVADHYREDGSCKCNDPEERRIMIEHWGYQESDFDGIPLLKK